MKNTVKIMKIFILIGLALIVFGGILYTVSMAANGWDFSKLSNVTVEYEVYEVNADQVNSIKIDFSVADITYEEWEENTVYIKFPITKNKKGEEISSVTVSGDENLSVSQNKNNALVTFFSFDFSPKTVTVKVPKGKVLGLNLETDTGDIIIGKSVETYSFNSLFAKTATGDINILSSLSVSSRVDLKTNTGKITSQGQIHAEYFSAQTDTGDINLSGNISVTNSVVVSVDTGDITVRGLVSANSVKLDNDTGDINALSGSFLAKVLNFENDTGDVKIKLFGEKSDYSVSIETDTGDSNISSYTAGERTCEISTDTGDIKVVFSE